MGIAATFVVATVGYGFRNEGINAVQTEKISQIERRFEGLSDEVKNEVKDGVKEGVREVLKELSYQLPENNIPATSLVQGTSSEESPKN